MLEMNTRFSFIRKIVFPLCSEWDFMSVLIKTMDLDSYSPKMCATIRRFAWLRYYRGLPITRKGSRVTLERELGHSRSMLTTINRVVLNRLADVWDESKPLV